MCRRPEAGISLTHEWPSPGLSCRWSPAPALGDLGPLGHRGPDVGGVFTLRSSSLDLHSCHFQGRPVKVHPGKRWGVMALRHLLPATVCRGAWGAVVESLGPWSCPTAVPWALPWDPGLAPPPPQLPFSARTTPVLGSLQRCSGDLGTW